MFGLAVELDVGSEGKERIEDEVQVSGLSDGENDCQFTEMGGRGLGRTVVGSKIRVSDLLNVRCL